MFDQKAYSKAYHKANREKLAARSKAWYEANKEKAKAWRDANKEKIKAQHKAYRKINQSRNNAHNAKRKASKIQRTPSWLSKEDLAKIKDLYRIARRRSEVEGILYHVDHIIPLQGKNISGLHVPNNLQVLRARDNIIKGNSYG